MPCQDAVVIKAVISDREETGTVEDKLSLKFLDKFETSFISQGIPSDDLIDA
jgi:vacuolar-type H+-ATPase subunit B/Vma2